MGCFHEIERVVEIKVLTWLKKAPDLVDPNHPKPNSLDEAFGQNRSCSVVLFYFLIGVAPVML